MRQVSGKTIGNGKISAYGQVTQYGATELLVCPMIVFVAYKGIRLCSLAASRGVKLLPTFPITGICTGATNAGKTFGLLTVMPDGLN